MRNIILFTILVAFTNLFANSADIYNKKFKTAKQGLYIENDIVFVVVDIQEKLKNGLYEGTGMLRRKVLIDKYLLSNQSTEVKTKNIIESNYIANIANPKNKKLSYNITEMQVLENGEANNSYRYVSAIKLNVLNEIKKNIEISTQSSISQMKLIKNKKLEILESEEYNDIEKYI